ncbi:hypothetical protein J2Z77_000153 [Streptomyces avidinii]|uniref:Uncharacterized protein n=2 Tax=Streptomyces avidinii TaxID=1895 RepID=A0ABS4KWG7_STRAV|nr:hypothetical protein [Streptomyces avidinii]
MRDPAIGEEVAPRLGNGGFPHAYDAIDQESPSSPGAA